MATFIYPQIDISDLAIAHIDTNTANTVTQLQTANTSLDNIETSTASTVTELQSANTALASLATSSNQTSGAQKSQIVDSAGNSVTTTDAGAGKRAIDVNLASGSIAASNPSVAPTGATVPAQATYIAGIDSGNLVGVKVSAAGELATTTSFASLPLPTGAATESTLSGLNTKVVTTANGIKVDGSAVTQPVSAASLPLPTGAATAANQTTANSSLSSIDAKLPANLTVSSTRLLVDGSGVTQPVSVASLPLPTGAATSANQTTANASLSSIDGKVATAANQTTANASLSSIDGKVSTAANQVTANASLSSIDGKVSTETTLATRASESTLSTLNGKIPSNLTVSSTRLLVDNSGVTQPVSQVGTAFANAPLYRDYASQSVGTVFYETLTTNLTNTANTIEIFDSSGQALYLATSSDGGATWTNQLIIFPGGNGRVNLQIPAGVRIAVKALTAPAASGYLAINLYR